MTDDQIQEPAPQPDVATELDRIGRIPGVRDRAGVGDGSVHDAVVALDGARVPQPDVAKVPLTVSEKHSLWMASGWESRGAFIRGVEAAERSHSDAAAPPPEPKGYLRNCELTQRRGPSEPDWIFYVDAAGNTYCQLDGYRIMPIDAPQPAVAAIISGLREQIEEQKLAILRSWDYGKHLEGEAMLWEERARHLGWRDEHGA